MANFIALTRIVIALLFCCAIGKAADDCGPNMFIVRQWDELVLKDGTVFKGQVSETDDGNYKVRDMRTNISKTYSKDMVRDVRFKATPETELDRLTKENSSNPRKMLCVAIEATTRFNLHAKVIPILERITAGNPNEGLLQKLGELYLNAGQNDRALKIADGLLKSNPKSARNLMLHGQALSAADKLDLAEKDLIQANKLAPGDDAISLAYADMLLRLGRADEAKKIFLEAIAANKNSPEPSTGLGFVDLRTGDFAAAETNFQTALGIKPDFVKARVGLSTAKLMTKQLDDAYTQCNLILNIDTESPEAYEIQAFARLFKGDPPSLLAAEDKIKDSLRSRPNQPRLTLAWSVLLDRLAKYEEIKSDKERNAPLQAQRRTEAQAKLNEVLSSDAPDSFIQFFIGEKRFREVEEAQRNHGDDSKNSKDTAAIETSLTQAETAFARAAKLSPRYPPAQGALGATLLRRKKWDEARAAFAKAFDADPKSPDAADYIAGQGLSLLNSLKFDEAGEFFNKALALDPNCVSARCGRGYIANWQRDKARAMDNFQRALAADGDCSYAANALQLIYKQDDREMEYVRFTGADWPKGWKPRTPGSIKLALSGGQAVFSGNQGAAMGSKLEVQKDYVIGGAFERLEADLQIAPDCPVTYGLRIASGSGPNPAFEFEFGKDESNELKVRYRDANGIQPAWTPTKTEWPKSGRVRLGIDTDVLAMGDCSFRLWVNGRKIAEVSTKFPAKPSRLSLGVFLQAPPQANVNASVNNIVVVKRGVVESGPEIQTDIKLITEPPKPDAPPVPNK